MARPGGEQSGYRRISSRPRGRHWWTASITNCSRKKRKGSDEEAAMRSDAMKKGLERAPHRSLFRAMGYTDAELARPFIGIANSANEVIPGHIHLNRIAQAVKEGIRMAGATPMEFSTIGICDGIAMGHEGMKYSLGSRGLT